VAIVVVEDSDLTKRGGTDVDTYWYSFSGRTRWNMLCTKVCEDMLRTEPKDLLVLALFGNGSDQIELGSNVYNMELLTVQKKIQTITLKGIRCASSISRALHSEVAQ
jgi:hypothetical protein